MTSLSSQLKALPRQNLEIGEKAGEDRHKSSIHSFLYHAVAHAKSTGSFKIEAYYGGSIARNYDNDQSIEKNASALIDEMNKALESSKNKNETLTTFIEDLSY